MARTDFYIKVVVDHSDSENPERLAAELCRMIQKFHGVRSAALQNYINDAAPASEG
jgi:hypothetical protein